ncbi:MAG: C40 family peptidase [Actinobacteria bacterium]|nr:C40 family peptidase [Actinomycetota bacterium]
MPYRPRRLALLILTFTLLLPGAASAAGGGLDPHPEGHGVAESPATEEACGTTCAATTAARLVDGEAIAPPGAPAGVQQVIAAANKIRTKPYLWGGGHGKWNDAGYDCSGAVSFALRGAKLLSTPLDSTSFETWGAPGAGRWITVYSNPGHAYAVIAGLRFDTAGGADGPRWYSSTAAAATGPFTARHPAGY